MTDQERLKHSFQGPGIRGPENPPLYTLPRLGRRKGARAGVAAVATALSLLAPLQANAVYDRTFGKNKSIAIVASAGVYFRSIEQQIARVPDSPPTTATTISQLREVRPAPPKQESSPATTTTTLPPRTEPAAEPKKDEQSICINEWETLSDGVCFTQFREFGSDVYAVRVDLKNPNVSVRPSFVASRPGRLGRLSDAVERLDAIVGMNASFSVGQNPVGPISALGEWLSRDTSPQQVLIVNNDNSLAILPTQQALKQDPKQMKFALPGSHVLVRNGIKNQNFGSDNPGGVLYRYHPRTAIGVDKNGYFYMVVVDGRSSKSRGVTMPELTGIMNDIFEVVDGVALDGGGSSQLAVRGDIINHPSNGSRSILTGVFTLAA